MCKNKLATLAMKFASSPREAKPLADIMMIQPADGNKGGWLEGWIKAGR